MDETDRELLILLQEDCRMSYGELGNRVGLSISAVNERLKKLHARGVIRGGVAGFGARGGGVGIWAVGEGVVGRPGGKAGVLAAIAGVAAGLEGHHLAGGARL